MSKKKSDPVFGVEVLRQIQEGTRARLSNTPHLRDLDKWKTASPELKKQMIMAAHQRKLQWLRGIHAPEEE